MIYVAADDVALTGFDDEDSLHAAGLFNLNDKTVEYGYKLFMINYILQVQQSYDCIPCF